MRYPVALEVAVFCSSAAWGCSASANVTLVTDRSGASSAVIGNYVYVLGGFHKGERLSSVERASINADGTIGTFETVTDASLVTPREFHTSAVVGNYLFVLGGDDGTSPIETIERAPINADSSLGSFATISTTSLLIPRNLATVTLVGTSFCAIGGEDTSKAIVKSVEQATVSNDGSMGTFATVSGVALETARYLHTTTIADNYVYIVGGNDGTNILASVERASINADGSIGAFATSTGGGLVKARMSHSSLVVDDQLYIFGGVNGPAADLNDVEHATINTDGSLGAFETVSGLAFVTPRVGTAMTVIKNYVYAFGGFGPQAPLNTVERATVSAAGSLGVFELLSD
jgi:hypothetical protein